MKAVFAEGGLWRHLLSMTAARSVGIMATFVVDFVDVLFISRLGDARLVAAVGFSAAALFFIRAIAIALGIATTALVAQAVGSGNEQRAARYAFNLSLLSFVLMATIATAVWLGRGTVLPWVGASGETLHFASGYLGIVLTGLPLLSLGNCGTATLFALGSARLAMLVSLSATLTQAALDPVFIFVLGWGLHGAALAAVCAQAVMAAVAWYCLLCRYRLRAPLAPHLLAADIPAITAIAFPAMLTNLTSPIATAYAARSMAQFGDAAVSAFAVIMRLVPLGFALLFSLSAAVAPIVGQNAGAARFDRVRETLYNALVFNFAVTATVCLLLFAARDTLPGWFTLSGEAAALLRYFCSGIALLYGCKGMIFFMNAAYNNLGRPFYATAANLACFICGSLPLITLGGHYFGARGVISGQMAEAVLVAPVCWLIVLRLTARRAAAQPR
ncbi:MATE family efflux transporter [uncultured Cardiobacterium sp.]|uniref:MATE family efflux transporter n=1 Tax=uncultured Cardiobacterium sp. TaxID=417619 RepID=UPI002612E28E|nr:MATE family efflux transporter [uncultured Cardiobacterium sp.]